ncbi:hypothetical protein GCM10008940_19420 [Microbulbifer agarilyticus]
MHQQNFPFSQVGTMYQVAPYGKEGLRQCRGFWITQPSGYRQALPFWCHCVFRITSTIGECAYSVTDFPALHARANGNDFPRHFQPEYVRSTWRWWIESCALHDIRAVNTSGCDADQYLALPRRRRIPLREQHLLGATMFRQINKAHEIPLHYK